MMVTCGGVRHAALALLIVIAACGSAQGDGATGRPLATGGAAAVGEPAVTASATPPADIELFADYPRSLWHLRRLNVATTNVGSEPIEVTSIALRAGHFEPLASEAKTTLIPPGARIDIQVDFGELVDCDPAAAPGAQVAIDITLDGDEPAPYLVEIDPAALDEIRDRECARRRVDENVAIGFSDARTVSGSTMETAIEVDRVASPDPAGSESASPESTGPESTGPELAGPEPVRIESLKGSVIIVMRPDVDAEPLASLDAGAAHASIPLELFVARCEPHALSQSTLTFELSAFVTVGDAPVPHKFVLPVDPELRGQLQGMIDHCSAQLAANDPA